MAKTKDDKPVDDKNQGQGNGSGGGNGQGQGGGKPDKPSKPWWPCPTHEKKSHGPHGEEVTESYTLVNQVVRGGKVYACHRSRSNPRQFVILCDGAEVSTQGTLRQAWEAICRS